MRRYCRLTTRAVSERRLQQWQASLQVRQAANSDFDVCGRRQLSKVWRSNQRGVSSFPPSALSD
jgi:hypothetical protein